MGICGSVEAPKELIPDPMPGNEYKVVFKKAGLFSGDDCYVRLGGEEGPAWLFIDKDKPKFFDSAANFYLMNFQTTNGQAWTRENGVVLCSARGDVLGKHTYRFRDINQPGSDSSQGYSATSDYFSRRTVFQRCKWTCKTRFKLYGDRLFTREIGELKVKAKGTLTRTLEQYTSTTTDANGNRHTSSHVRVNYIKKIKKMKYYYTPMPGTYPPPMVQPEGRWVFFPNPGDPTGYGQYMWSMGPPQPGEYEALRTYVVDGSFNRPASWMKWQGELFDAQNNGGWLSVKPYCVIKPHMLASPVTAMMVAYLCTIVLAPDDIKDKLPTGGVFPGIQVPGYGYYSG